MRLRIRKCRSNCEYRAMGGHWCRYDHDPTEMPFPYNCPRTQEFARKVHPGTMPFPSRQR